MITRRRRSQAFDAQRFGRIQLDLVQCGQRALQPYGQVDVESIRRTPVNGSGRASALVPPPAPLTPGRALMQCLKVLKKRLRMLRRNSSSSLADQR